jgi:CDP-diacylglycerol---serine O-phosphatidyltransferase
MKQIPNIFTLLNLFFGCIAIIYTLQNGIIIQTDLDGTQLLNIPEKIWLASLFIGLAGVIDFVDGFVARLFKVSSEMGKQLDSLADVVSFGVAPGLILYQLLRLSVAAEENGIEASTGWLLPALLIPCAAAYRLAKFNLDDSQQYGFRGMPTPAVGMLIASFPLIYWYSQNNAVTGLLFNKWALYAIIILLCYLMLSNISLLALKFKDYSIKNNIPKFLLAAITIVAAILLQWMAVPVVFICYIAVSLAFRKKNLQ